MARTQLSGWQIPSIESSGKMKYIELSHSTVAHVANSIVVYRLNLPDDIDGINLKTIRVISDENLSFVVRLMDGDTDMPIYESLEEIKYQYDNVDIPYKPTERAVFVEIHNKGTITTKYHINLRGIEVK